MNKRLLVFIFIIMSIIPTYAQYITGKVVADDDGLPLVGATVWFKDNPTAKVRVGENGFYRIKFRQGILIFHCFGFNDSKVNIRKTTKVNIRLKPESSNMAEVVVQAKKKKYTRKGNPAVEIMEKVIAAKKSTDMRQQDYVTFEKYARTMIAINEFSADTIEDENLKKKKSFLAKYAETCPETGKTIVPISIEEKKSTEFYTKDGNKTKSLIHGHHSESLLDLLSASEFLETKFKDNLKDVDIYKNEVVLLEHNFISPIGDGAAIRFYHYNLKDSAVYVEGEKCFQIQFFPANTRDIGFSGDLYITKDSTWRVKRAKFGVPVSSNINFIRSMKIDQEYVALPNGSQICNKNRMMMELKLTSYLKKLYVDYNVTYSDWCFDSFDTKQIDFLGDEKYDKGAKNRSNTYWAEARPDTLSKSEAGVAEMKKKFTDRPVVKAAIYGMRIIFDNYLETSTDPNKPSKVLIGPFFSMIGNNYVEGWHFRLGAQTTGALNKHWFFKGWAKYGFGDQKVKGEAQVAYSFNEKEKDIIAYPIRSLTFTYSNDIQSPGDKFLEFNRDNAFMSIAWNSTHFMTYFERFRLAYEWEFNNGLHITSTALHEYNKATGDLYFRTVKDYYNNCDKGYENGYNTNDHGSIKYNELQMGVEYQPGVKYLNTKTKRYLANREAPIYGIQHIIGTFEDNSGNGLHVYNYTEFTLKKRFWLKSWGSIDAFHSATFQWNHVPFQLLCLPRSNFSYIRSDNTFALIRNMEFLNDRTFTMMYRWDLNGKLFNRIPLIKKLKWREAIGFNLMWGYLTAKNNPERFNVNSSYFAFRYPDGSINYDKMQADPSYNYLYRLPGTFSSKGAFTQTTQIMNSWKPYAEVSIGIHNIWKFFSVDYYKRLTYNNAKGVSNWGFRFAFEASF